MPSIKHLISTSVLLGLMSLPAFAHSNHDPLAMAVESDFRQAKNVNRDQYRHPEQTLSFFELQPSDSVIELWPGGGWYAEILGPYLAKKGQYIGASFDTQPKEDTPRTRYRANAGKKFLDWTEKNPKVFANASVIAFDPPAHVSLGADNSVDKVLTFRNLHNWAVGGQLETVFESAYKVLKPGGIFGVVEHRANAGMSIKTGYMEQDKMIKLAEKVGFVLVASSEINANSKDVKAYPKGVWTLPPVLAMKEEDKAKYLAIGESDRMTLKFIKKEAK